MSPITEAFKHVLCMDIDEHAFRVAAVHKEKKNITEKVDFELQAFDKESIQANFSHAIFKQEYDGFCLTLGAARNTLIPVDLFNHSTAKAVFQLAFPEPYDNIDYTRIPELGMVNIAEIPMWIKSTFIVKLPRTKIIHKSTALLKGIFAGDTFRPQLHIQINFKDFELFYTDKKCLHFYNRFDFSALSDIVYHSLYLIEQKELDQTKLTLYIYGVDAEWADLKEFSSFFKAPVIVDTNSSKSKDFDLISQLLCV